MKKIALVLACFLILTLFYGCTPQNNNSDVSEKGTDLTVSENSSGAFSGPNSDTSTNSSENTSTESKFGDATNVHYTIYVESGMGSAATLPEGNHTLKFSASSNFTFTSRGASTHKVSSPSAEYRNGKTFRIDGKEITFVPDTLRETPFSTVQNKYLQENYSFFLRGKNADCTFEYTSTGLLTEYWHFSLGNSGTHLSEDELLARAERILNALYGEEFMKEYSVEGITVGKENDSNVNDTVTFLRRIHGYATNDRIALSFADGEVFNLAAPSVGYMADCDLTLQEIKAAEDYLAKVLKVVPDGLWIVLNDAGEYYLKARTEDAFYWISLE
ncbi:MAG: hypothetical protein II348_02725 [Clostridia bacterium]|nr:hypothetical protein [Clostridia bacterium]